MRPRTFDWVALLASCSLILAPGVAASVSQAQTSEQQPVRVGGAIQPPQKIKDVKPVYPPQAQQAHAQGVVVIEATVGPDGRVREARVLRSIPLLDQAAIDAVRQWEYTPTIVNGAAAPVIMTVTVNFSMQEPVPGAAFPPPTDSLVRLAMGSGPAGAFRVWEISRERAAHLPRWDPQSSSIPISMTDAVSRAVSWLKERNQDIDRFELQNAVLSRRRQYPDVDFWFYQLDFMPPVGGALLKVVILPDGSFVEPRVERAPQPAIAPPASPGDLPPGVFRVGPGVSAPRALKQVNPEYPEEAMKAKIQGAVAIEVIVTPEGNVVSPRVIRSLDPVLDEAALRALKEWRFAPGMKDGRPVPVMTTVEMTFTLR
jgi:protein TonB